MVEATLEIPCSLIEDELRVEHRLEEPLKIVSCRFDEHGDSMLISIELENDDFARMARNTSFGQLVGEVS